MAETMGELLAALDKIDAATTKIGSNVQASADLDQKISDELDTLITQLHGSGVSPELVKKAQDLADRLQKNSDALDAQVPVLAAMATRAGNPVPVPVPEPPAPPVP